MTLSFAKIMENNVSEFNYDYTTDPTCSPIFWCEYACLIRRTLFVDDIRRIWRRHEIQTLILSEAKGADNRSLFVAYIW